MSDSEIIANQRREIHELEKLLAELKDGYCDIYEILYCIGGPLNDNKDGYSKHQLVNFIKISHITKDFIELCNAQT